jgi:DNA-binding transcriptional LysR family regulator
LTVEPAFELDQFSDMIRLAALGVGVTLVPRTSTQPIAGEARHTADFVAVPLADPTVVHPIGVVYDADRLTPAAAAFLETVPGIASQD